MSANDEGPDAGERRAHNDRDDLSKIANTYIAPEAEGLDLPACHKSGEIEIARIATRPIESIIVGERIRQAEVEIVDADAVHLGKLYEKARASLVDSVRHQIECGSRLAEKRASLPYGTWLPWLEANAGVLGFDSRQTATRLMKIASNGASTHHLNESEAVKISRLTWGNSTVRGTQGTGENEWYTPEEYVEAARGVLGEIDLDPASSKIAQKSVKATKFFSLDDDGLEHEWHGRVWLNPPYAQPFIAEFVSKMIAERRARHVSAAIMLTHNYTDTSWFHEGASIADAICFTRGRVKFYDAAGTIAAPTQGQAFFYFGDESLKFAARFGNIGFVLMPTGGSYCETFQRQALSGWGGHGDQAPATLPREDADDLEIPSFLRRASA